jgi:hypothetical protein
MLYTIRYLYYWFSVGEDTLPLHHLITQNTPAKPGIVHSLATAKLSRYHENKKVARALTVDSSSSYRSGQGATNQENRAHLHRSSSP